jgi:hypothetical protein
MAVNGDHLELIRALRMLGVLHYKSDGFEVSLGYPFAESAPKAATPSVAPIDAFDVQHAADLVLFPPDFAKLAADEA